MVEMDTVLVCPSTVMVEMDTALVSKHGHGGEGHSPGTLQDTGRTVDLPWRVWVREHHDAAPAKKVQTRAGCSLRIVGVQLWQAWVLGSSTEGSKCQTLPRSWRMDTEM